MRALLAEHNVSCDRLVLVQTPTHDPDTNRIEWLWRAARRATPHCHTHATLDPLLDDATPWARDLSPAAVPRQFGSPFAPDTDDLAAVARGTSEPVDVTGAAQTQRKHVETREDTRMLGDAAEILMPTRAASEGAQAEAAAYLERVAAGLRAAGQVLETRVAGGDSPPAAINGVA